jgi:DNA-binding CsgD family transcriptional regulator
LFARLLAVLGVGVWCFFVLFAALGMVVDRGLADSPWAWIGILSIGVVAPAVLLTQLNRAITSYEDRRSVRPDPRDRERELLEAARNGGEISPATAAMRTSLTVEEAAAMLAELADKDHLRVVSRDGMPTYSLFEIDRLGKPAEGTTTLGLSVETSELLAGDGALDRRPHKVAKPLTEPLSEREREVLALLATGRTNREIAGDLFVSLGTVKSHTSNIYGKLESRNRAEAIGRARELNLLP